MTLPLFRSSIVALLIVLLSVALVSAAGPDLGRLGIRAGWTESNMRGDGIHAFPVDPIAGYSFGAFYSIGLTRHIVVQPEISICRLGLKRTFNGFIPIDRLHFTEQLHLTYLEGSLILRLPYPGPTSRQLSVLFGATARYGISGKADGGWVSDSGDSYDYNTKIDNFHRFDLALTVGGSFRLETGLVPLVFDLRYMHGLVNPFDNVDLVQVDPLYDYYIAAPLNGDAYELKNSNLAFTVGVMLGR